MIKTLIDSEIKLLLTALQAPCQTSTMRMKAARNYTIAVLMLDAGLRVSEVAAMRVEDLIFQEQPREFIAVRSEIAKRGKARTVPVSARLKGAIDEMLKTNWLPRYSRPEDYAFWVSNPAEHITTRQIQRVINLHAEKALGRSIHPHVLRHTFASRMMRVTSIRVVQQLLGHNNLSSTQIYTHPSSNDLTEAVKALDDRSKSSCMCSPATASICEVDHCSNRAKNANRS